MRNLDNKEKIESINKKYTPESPFLVDLFNEFNRSNIIYCVLRNYEELPYGLNHSDLDVLISPEYLEIALESIRTIARNHNANHCLLRKNIDLFAIYCFGTTADDSHWGVPIHLEMNMRWKGLDYYNIDQVFINMLSQNGVNTASKYDASIIGLLKEIIHNGRLSVKYHKEASDIFKQYPEAIGIQMDRIFSKRGELVINVLRGKDSWPLKKLVRNLRRSLFIQHIRNFPHSSFKKKFRNFLIHSRRLFKKPGIFIAVLGLDGSGKSTLISLLRKDIQKLLHVETECRHLRPGFLPPLAIMKGQYKEHFHQVTNPHTKQPSGIIVSIFRVIYYVIDYIVGYWVLIYPKLIRNPNIHFFDRYYYDFFIDPKRYRINIPNWILQLFIWIVPQPDLTIMIKPNPNVFIQRKPELPLKELNRQSDNMYNVGNRLNNVIWIDTINSIQSSKENMLSKILETFREHF